MNMDLHLAQTFAAAERSHPDLMEPYSVLLAEAEDATARVAIMRRGLRETIRQRFPLPGEARIPPRSADVAPLASGGPAQPAHHPRSSRNSQA
jgi:hypothetical protein